MLGHSPFYNESIRKYVICFGTCFNDLSITRKSKGDGSEKTIKVPLFYSTKAKQLNHLLEDNKKPDAWHGGKEFPRLSFEMTGLSYASGRKNNTMHYTLKDGEGKSRMMTYSPAPYDLGFQLVAYTVYQEDLYQIVEQILPFFQPEYCVKVKEIPSLNLTRDVHIVLTGVNLDLDRTGDYRENYNFFTGTMDFSLKGFFFGPAETKPVITNLDAQLWNLPAGEDWLAQYHAEGDVETKTVTKEEWTENN